MNAETLVNSLCVRYCSNETEYLMFIGYLAKCVDRAELERYYRHEIQTLEGESQ